MSQLSAISAEFMHLFFFLETSRLFSFPANNWMFLSYFIGSLLVVPSLSATMPLTIASQSVQILLLLIYVYKCRRRVQTVVKASSRVDKFSKSDIIVSPSILSANFSKLGEQVCCHMDPLLYHFYI